MDSRHVSRATQERIIPTTRILSDMVACAQGCRWLLMVSLVLYLSEAEVVQEGHDLLVSRAKILVHPNAGRFFPMAQRSAACGIITIGGLGSLDGDYALVKELTAAKGRPAWSRTTLRDPYVLSWHEIDRAWTVGITGSGVHQALLRVDSDIPPSHSKMWQVVAKDSSVFETVDKPVPIHCPGKLASQCEAVHPGYITLR